MSSRPHRSKTKREASLVRRYWWLVPVLLVVAFIGWVATGPEWSRPRTGNPTVHDLPPGYQGAFTPVAQEYQRFHGRPLEDRDLSGQFDAATHLMKQHDYGGAAQMLEEVAKKAAVPAVFNNLGLAYLALNDREHAINAFREVLARDIDYPQVRQNLDRMKEIGFENATPLTQEVEPNNTLLLTNIIAAGKAVEGEIMAAVNDVDCYRVTAPGAPRDLLRIELTPRTPKLAPMLKIYDSERRMVEFVKGKDAPGKAISWVYAPPPNSTVYLEVWAADDTAGLYTLQVTPLQIQNARPVQAGVEATGVDGNIFVFEAAKAGRVRVTLKSKSGALVLSTFGPELQPMGSENSFAVEAGKKHFLQVSSAGEYTLRVE